MCLVVWAYLCSKEPCELATVRVTRVPIFLPFINWFRASTYDWGLFEKREPSFSQLHSPGISFTCNTELGRKRMLAPVLPDEVHDWGLWKGGNGLWLKCLKLLLFSLIFSRFPWGNTSIFIFLWKNFQRLFLRGTHVNYCSGNCFISVYCLYFYDLHYSLLFHWW